MKIWHDDVRPAPEGWERASTNRQAIALLKNNEVDTISLDHDLGSDDEGNIYARGQGAETGLDLVKAMIEHDLVPPHVIIHSWNPSGAWRMANELSAAGHGVTIQPFVSGA